MEEKRKKKEEKWDKGEAQDPHVSAVTVTVNVADRSLRDRDCHTGWKTQPGDTEAQRHGEAGEQERRAGPGPPARESLLLTVHHVLLCLQQDVTKSERTDSLFKPKPWNP